MNKTLLKLAGLLFCFSVIDVLFISYWWVRCVQTQSSFYCDSFMFGGIILSFGIPALVLLGLSLIVLAFSKWYIGNVSAVLTSVIVILGIIILIAPYSPLLLPGARSETYQEFQNRMEKRRLEQEKEKERQCADYKRRVSEHREGQPRPVPPPGCN